MVNGYKSGNTSDIFKHSNLELLIDLSQPNFNYIEMHSGAGKYAMQDGSIYLGSNIRVLNKGKHKQAILHEKNPETRNLLEQNISGIQNVVVKDDWTKYITEYKQNATESDIVLFDPTKMSDYPVIINHIPELVKKGQTIFLYAPQNIGDERVKDFQMNIIYELHKIITDALPQTRTFRDFIHGTPKKGFYERIDHNIIVAIPEIIEKMQNNHDKLRNKYCL